MQVNKRKAEYLRSMFRFVVPTCHTSLALNVSRGRMFTGPIPESLLSNYGQKIKQLANVSTLKTNNRI